MGRGVNDFSSINPVSIVTKRTDRVKYQDLHDSIRDGDFVSATINEAWHEMEIEYDSLDSEYYVSVSNQEHTREMRGLSEQEVHEKISMFELSPASFFA